MPVGAATTVAARVLHLRHLGSTIKDPGAASAQQAANSGEPPNCRTGSRQEPGLRGEEDFVRAVLTQAKAITASEP
jgi:hypothetical protein